MMSEKDHAPLSTACVRALHDKLYDKRKTAALEIEKMVKEFAAVNNNTQIRRLLKVLADFCTSQNPHARKGGLIGLAAIAIALGKDTSVYTTELIFPILACFSDTDHRVRYFACESLYNVVKVARSSVLPHFTIIFNALSKLATDPEQSVKNASELLDRLMKDIVTENPSFDLEAFMPLLRERIYTKSAFAKQFVISWISVLDAVPNIDLILYLPEILDGLFKILEDTTMEIKKLCDIQLGEFLRSIKADPSRVDFASMINILINHAQASDELVQLTAITWIKEFVQLSGSAMLPFMSGIFTAVLPCLAYDTDARRRTDIKETATAVNFTCMKLISTEVDQEQNSFKLKSLNNAEAGDTISEIPIELDLDGVVKVLSDHLRHNSVQTKVAVLRWILHLYTKIPLQMFGHIEKLFPTLLDTLSDSSDEVVQHCLIVMAEIISSPAGRESHTIKDQTVQTNSDNISQNMSPYYSKFFINLLKLFSMDKQLLENKGSFIIRQLCVLLNAEDIYRTLAQVLLTESNLKFASLMVEELGIILLTSSELFELRTRLKDLKTEECCALFSCLYETWCHNPVATVALCLLTQSYSHACDLIRIFGNLEVTVEFLTEIDKLVQLLESPIFAYLRLELLEVPCDQHLVRALYGLLMLLPQSEAFQTLRTRLACIPSLHLHCNNTSPTITKELPARLQGIDYKKLLDHFIEVQEKHKSAKQMQRTRIIKSLEREISQFNSDL